MSRFLSSFLCLILGVIFPLVGSGELAQQGTGTGARQYFEWGAASAARFEEHPIGRAYGVTGGKLLGIGGRDSTGALVDLIEVIPLDAMDGGSVVKATLSQPVAFAAATQHNGKVYLLGGLGLDGVTDRVVQLEWIDGALLETELPPLPEPLMLAGAAVHRSVSDFYLYAIGGVSVPDATDASNRMYELEISQLGNAVARWVRMPDLPFGGRVAPSTVETYNEIVVFGGYTLGEGGEIQPSDECWGYSRVPRDGHAEAGWEARAKVPRPLARPAFSKSGQSHITVIGGDAAGGRLPDLVAGTKPVEPLDSVLSFHDPFSVWHLIGKLDKPAYGGILVPVDRTDFLWADARKGDGGVIDPGILHFLVSTKKLQWPDWVVLVGYFLVVACIGYHFARRQSGANSFALGGRHVKWWASGLSLMASGVSTISFMALPALTACVGLAQKGPILFMIFGMLVSAYLTYPILRRLNITSTFEYIEQRFGLGLRLVGSFNSIIVQMMGRIGIVVMLPALAISTMIGLDPRISILAMGLVTTLYAAAGGFEAVIWTDVVQGLLLLFGFLFIGLLAFMNIDGGMTTLIQYGYELDRLNFFLWKPDLQIANAWFAILGFVLQTMAFASDQVTAQRVLAIPMKDVRKIAFMGGSFGIFVAFLSGAVGIALFGFFKNNPEFLNPVMENDQMVPIFIVNKIPAGMAGLILATLFAAAMSTVSSSVNVCGVLVGEDFYKRIFKNVNSKAEMRVMQAVTLISGALGTGMALFLLSLDLPTLWESFMRIMAYLGGGFGGIYILGMFTRRTHELGAIIGVVVSFFMAWFLNTSDLHVHYSALGVFVTFSCVSVGYLSSLIIPWRRKPLTGLTVWDQVKEQVTDEELEVASSEAEVVGNQS